MRKFPLTPSLAAALEQHLEEHVRPDSGRPSIHHLPPAVFRFATGTSGSEPGAREPLAPLVGVHILRHSAVAALIRSGASPTAVQKILGHRSAAFTLTVYGHIFEADSDVVAENLERNWTEGDASQGRLTLARLKPRRSAGT